MSRPCVLVTRVDVRNPAQRGRCTEPSFTASFHRFVGMRMLSFRSSSGVSVGDSVKSRPSPVGVHNAGCTPLGMYSAARRTGGFDTAAAARAGIIASSHGNPRLAPAPRNRVLLDSLNGHL